LNEADGSCECRFLHQAIPFLAEELLIIDTYALVWDVDAIGGPVVNDTEVVPDDDEEEEEDNTIIPLNETEAQGNQTEVESEVLPSDIANVNVTDE